MPLWPAKIIVPICFSVLALRLVLQLWGYARAFAEGTDQPIAVPLVKSAAELAAEEAEHVQGADDGETTR